MPITPRHPAPHVTSRARGAASLRGSTLLVALLLSACVQSPQAAVSAQSDAGGVAWAAPHSGCGGAQSGRAALDALERELRAQGLVLSAACRPASGAWAVQVRVLDGMKASHLVRGPLADGHEVDMGTPTGVEAPNAALTASGFSPDVEHNRQWLRALMARHQFDNVPGAWWHFARRSASTLPSPDTDLAAR
ncbi:D-Ala-D-Ala dipeptidase [Paracidovorax sp. MALMAid1276]|uniref:D-Ala-D-Ala dipeptidase n=1 Tax=Paracidovorax sp. MALMAid1276 TaxID=3411631 RepID=UPI003B9CA4BA